MEHAIQAFASVNFFVIGFSHLFQRRAWIEYFAKLHSLGRIGPFAEGFLYLNFGALIVAFHSVWTFPEVSLTFVGWVLVAKAFFRFIAPEATLRVYGKMTHERAWQLQMAGGVAVGLGALFAFLALRHNVS